MLIPPAPSCPHSPSGSWSGGARRNSRPSLPACARRAAVPGTGNRPPGSLLSSLLEETYEVVEAIELEDDAKLCEELGDLMMLVVMLSCIAQEHGLLHPA